MSINIARPLVMLVPALLVSHAVIAEAPRSAIDEPTSLRAAAPDDCNLALGSSLAVSRSPALGTRLDWEDMPGAMSYQVFRCPADQGPCIPWYLDATDTPWYIDYNAFFSLTWYLVEVVESPCEGSDHFCRPANGVCQGPGVCTERIFECPHIWIPVCGCDGVTYSNECFSDGAGVGVFRQGPC